MPVVGTAGHVDHGKSTLVETLTGRDPDRWREEKERGLTIDLGFAWTVLPSGIEIGFVDVPGHERFIKNMLAGVGGMDVAMLVVAADEGWMPQSEEHMAVLDLMGVRAGVVALSRIDLVDEETVELATLEVADRLDGSALQDWPILPVSPITGKGIGRLAEELDGALAQAGPPPDMGRPRLWIDRSFTIKGAGAVVTGTLVGGSVTGGDELELWPGARRVRARSLQTHERATDRVEPGNRLAINLAGVERADIVRGSMLALPGAFRSTSSILVDLRTVRELPDPLTDRGAYHLHVGTGAWAARLRLLAGRELRGRGAALLHLAAPVPLTMGDRLLVRDTGRRSVVAGGRVIDPAPTRDGRTATAAAEILQPLLEESPDQRADGLLVVRAKAGLSELAADSGGGRPTAGLITDSWAVSADERDHLLERAAAATGHYQEANPLRPGIPKSTLASSLQLDLDILAAVIGASGGSLIDDGATVRTVDFRAGLGAAETAAWASARRQLLEAGLSVPRASELGLKDEVLHALVRQGALVKVGDDLVYLPGQIDEITTRLGRMSDGFTVAEFRDQMETTRRQAVPLLEWLDAEGWTTRRGDVRMVRRRPG